MSSLIACFVDASEVATAEEARPRFPPCPKTHGYSSRHSVEQIGGARPYINRGAQRRRLRRCGPRTITANGTGAGQERWIIIDMDSCGDEFGWEFGNAEAGLEASCRTDAFFGRKRPYRKKTPYASTRPRVRFRSDGPDGSTGTAGPRRSTLKHCEAATPGKRERGAAASGLSPQPSPHSLRRWRLVKRALIPQPSPHPSTYPLYRVA